MILSFLDIKQIALSEGIPAAILSEDIPAAILSEGIPAAILSEGIPAAILKSHCAIYLLFLTTVNKCIDDHVFRMNS